MKRIWFVVGLVILIFLGFWGLVGVSKKQNYSSEKVSVVATLFPQYDFAKVIGGDKVDVSLLLPPGVEAHAYEPKPSDIAKINNADIFVYTGEFMEPWAHDIVEGATTTLKIVEVSDGVFLLEGEKHEDEVEYEHGGVDPHVWLDFDNAKIMARNITEALVSVDPQNASFYNENLRVYNLNLDALHSKYIEALGACGSRKIVYGGHYAFGYMANKYDLDYVSAQGFAPDSEPSAKDLISLVEQIKKGNIGYIFYEELTSPKIAETLAKETKAKLLLLNAAHNLTKDDYEAGATFLSIMQKNLDNLVLGLGCKK